MRDASIKLSYFLLVLLALYGVWSFFFRVLGNNNINEILRKVDSALVDADYTTAHRLLRSINRRGLSDYDRLRILARAFELGDKIGDFTYLEQESSSATKAYSKREDFRAFQVFALLENQKMASAAKIAQSHITDLRFKDIRNRAILSQLFKDAPNPFLAAEKQLLENVEADFYLEMAQLLQDPILYFNTALLLLEKQEYTKARELLYIFAQEPSIATFKRALLAYELGDTELAFQLLNSLPPHLLQNIHATLLLADLHLVQQNYISALELYRTALAMDPLFDPAPWLNVALLTERFYEGSQDIVMATLNQAVKNFPNSTELILSLAQRLPYRIDAKNLVESFRANFPTDARAYLFWLIELTDENQLDTISSNLWDLFNSNSDNGQLARYMVWFFLGQKNFDDAYLVLERFKGSDRSWMKEYEAIILAIENRTNDAMIILLEQEKTWSNLYNLALLQIYMNQFDSAIQNLITAIALYAASEDPSMIQLAALQAKLAQAYLSSGRTASAATAAQESVRLNADNALALQVLQKLAFTN